MSHQSRDESPLNAPPLALPSHPSPITRNEILSRLHQHSSSPPSHTALYSLIEKYPASPPPSLDDADELADALSMCLELSCRAGDIPIVEWVFDHWESLTLTAAPDADILLELLIEAGTRGQEQVVRCLFLHGATAASFVPGVVAVNAAKDTDLQGVFRAFIEGGQWNINASSESGKPAVTYVVDRPALLDCFLTWGADPNAVGNDGLTPLDAAAGLATPAAIDLLIAKGARVGDSYPLHQAVARHGPESVSIGMIDHLLNLGVDVNAVQFCNHLERMKNKDLLEDFGTPLHCAARSGSRLRVVHLLKKGANPMKLSSKGNSVLSWAEKARRPKAHPDMLKLLAELEDKSKVPSFSVG